MNILTQIAFMFLKRIGTFNIKRKIWNKEFKNGKWDFLQLTSEDIIYRYIEKYLRNGSILDLGCGNGNISMQLQTTKYFLYTGVDISDEAIQNARLKCESDGIRYKRNEYQVADILEYRPNKKYNIILFRESLYYLRKSGIKEVLNRYLSYLNEGGVIMVRLYDRDKYGWIINLIEKEYYVLEKYCPVGRKTTVLIFQGHRVSISR